MAHKDSKSTIQSTPRENIIYDDIKNSISLDDKDTLANAAPENTGSESSIEAISPKEPDPEDAELINMLKSEEGSNIIRSLCKSDSVKNMLISFMQDSNNPELRKALSDSIFSQYFDSTQLDIKSDSLTPITDLLKSQPQNKGILSNILVKMQSNILIKHLLDESIKSNSPDVRSFVIDTLVRMDSQLVVSEILDQQEQSDLLFNLLKQISKKSDSETIFLQTNKKVDPNDTIPLEMTEPKRIVATRPRPKAPTSEPYGGNSPEFESKDNSINQEDYEQEHKLSFWDRIKDNISQVIEPISNISTHEPKVEKIVSIFF